MQSEVQRARVLVVDDEPMNRALCKRLLSSEHDVLETVDRPSALALLQKQPIDLVLLDVMMPGMNGFEVCAQIKAAGRAGLSAGAVPDLAQRPGTGPRLGCP